MNCELYVDNYVNNPRAGGIPCYGTAYLYLSQEEEGKRAGKYRQSSS